MERRRPRRGLLGTISLALAALVMLGAIVIGLAALDVRPVDAALERVSVAADLPVDLSRPHEWAPRILGRPVVEEQPSSEEGIRTGTITFEDDDFVVTIFIPRTGNPIVDSVIEQRLQRRIDALAEQLQIGDLDQVTPPSGERPEVRNEINTTFDIDYASETVVAFRLETRIYHHGVGARTANDAMIFNLADGTEILPGDLFRRDSGYLERLSELSRQKLSETLPAELQDRVGQERIAHGTAPLAENFNGISISPDWETGILVYFDEGQVTPLGYEPPQIAIALEEVEDLLNPATIVLTHPRFGERLRLQGQQPEPTPTRSPEPATATPQPTATSEPVPAAPTAEETAPVPTPTASPAPPAVLTPAPSTVPEQPQLVATPTLTPAPVAATPTAPVVPPADDTATPTAAGPGGKVDCSQLRCIALTFDDGPSPLYTAQILDVFKAEGGSATFFVLGPMAQESPDLLRRMVAEGHEIGNHTWSHKQLTTLTPEEIRQEIQQTQDVVRSIVGFAPRIFRPPYGATNDQVREIAGLREALWNVDTDDWLDRDTAIVTQRVLESARPGAIVLMHDIHATTAQAVPTIVRTLKQQGYTLVTFSQLHGE